MKRLDPFRIPLTGVHLIEASAGTGKTYTIATLVLRLLIERRLEIRQILVVTFTVAATAELRGRIRERLAAAVAALGKPEVTPDDPVLAYLVREAVRADRVERDRDHLLEAIHAFDEAAVLTIHGFCLRVLQENAFESRQSFEPRFLPDSRGLYAQIAQDFWASQTYQGDPELVRYLVAEGVTPAALTTLVSKVAQGPDVQVYPSEPQCDDASCAQALERFRACHARAAQAWSEEGPEIVNLLATYRGLNRNKYRPPSIRGRWRRDIDAVMAAPLPRIVQRFKQFASITQSGINQGLNVTAEPLVHPFFELCEDLWQADEALQRALAQKKLALLVELCQWAPQELARRKHAQNLQSYDDILLRVVAALRDDALGSLARSIRARYPAALIDEFQDTDAAQYEIFRRTYASGEGALYLIGDPKQAIYRFRGADIFAYLAAKKDSQGHASTLDVNWRSDPGLLQGLNALFTAAQRPFIFTDIEALPAIAAPEAKERLLHAGPPVRVLWAAPDPENPDHRPRSEDPRLLKGVSNDIVALLTGPGRIDGRGVQPRDVAVLTRTNAQAKLMQRTLRALGVPAVVQGDASVFDEPEAVEMERILTAMAQPRNARALRAAITTTTIGVTAGALHALRRDDAQWDAWVDRFSAYHLLWKQRGFIQAHRRLLDDLDIRPRLLAFTDGERRLTNLRHLEELLHAQASLRRLGPEALVAWLNRMRRDVGARSEVGEDAARLRLESDEDAVSVVTVHKSKGLEYPIVYAPFVGDGMLLHPRDRQWGIRFADPDSGAPCLDLGSPAFERHQRLAEREALAENLRLLYVAVTRARHQINLVWGPLWGREKSALGYLVHQRPSGTVFDSDDLAESTRLRLVDLSDADMRQDIERWITRAEGAVGLHVLSPKVNGVYRVRRAQEERLHPRSRRRSSWRSRRVSSFTAMTLYQGGLGDTRGAGALPMALDVGLDRDPGAGRSSSEPSVPLERLETGVAMQGVPAGARTGLMFHHILERVDFADPEAPEVEATIRRALAEHGMSASLIEPMQHVVRRVLTTTLPESKVRLCDVPRGEQVRELSFLLAVRSEHRRVPLGPEHLAHLFDDARHPVVQAYGKRVTALGFAPWWGFLTGYIDLVYRAQGRWYVVDYKTNDLGPTLAHYGEDALAQAMVEHDYPLQLVLYCLAVHRTLGARVPSYDYDQHFGGAQYLFVRGMGASGDEGAAGVFTHRPPRQVIERLDALLRDGEPASHRGGTGRRADGGGR